MDHFERLRRPYIIVSADFPLDEAIEAHRSRVKPEPPPPNQPVLSKVEGPAPPPRSAPEQPAPLALPALSGAEEPALSQAEGSAVKGSLPKALAWNKTEGSRANPPRPRREPPRRPTPSGPPDPGRHERKCRVCSHPDRDAIEEAFIHWHSPTLIAQDYQISDDSLYRHAYATGLDAVRSRNLRCALERILEKAQRVVPTADSIVRAARAYTRINDAGEWVEPPMHVIVSSGSAFHLSESRACPSLPAEQAGGRRAAADPSSPCTERSERVVTDRPSRPSSNRGIRELENGSTR